LWTPVTVLRRPAFSHWKVVHEPVLVVVRIAMGGVHRVDKDLDLLPGIWRGDGDVGIELGQPEPKLTLW